MLREPLPISLLSLWSDLNNVEFNNVVVSASETERGVGIWASGDSVAESPNLVRVPRELVLSVQTIWEFAKSDHQLHSILAALGDFTKVTMRSRDLDIDSLIFLDCQRCYIDLPTSPDHIKFVRCNG